MHQAAAGLVSPIFRIPRIAGGFDLLFEFCYATLDFFKLRACFRQLFRLTAVSHAPAL